MPLADWATLDGRKAFLGYMNVCKDCKTLLLHIYIIT